jgi:hypothetical protein
MDADFLIEPILSMALDFLFAKKASSSALLFLISMIS